MVATRGAEQPVALRRADDGVPRALGLTDAELSRRWSAWVEERHLLVKPRWFTRRR